MDQAARLRKLVMQNAGQANASHAPRLLAVTGGQGGAGGTTVATRLAMAIAGRGVRTVLVDAALHNNDATNACGVLADEGLADVLAARRGILEVLQMGPSGMWVIAGLHSPRCATDLRPAAQQRLLRQFAELADTADMIIVDAGSGGSDMIQRFWSAADDIIVVTTTDAASVMDSYALIKRMADGARQLPLRLVLNRVADTRRAADVFQRIAVSAQKFLGLKLELLGSIPKDDAAASNKEVRPSDPGPIADGMVGIVERLMFAPGSAVTIDTACAVPDRSRWGDFPKTIQSQPGFSPIKSWRLAVPRGGD